MQSIHEKGSTTTLTHDSLKYTNNLAFHVYSLLHIIDKIRAITSCDIPASSLTITKDNNNKGWLSDYLYSCRQNQLSSYIIDNIIVSTVSSITLDFLLIYSKNNISTYFDDKGNAHSQSLGLIGSSQ